jgi:hypothetical protein
MMRKLFLSLALVFGLTFGVGLGVISGGPASATSEGSGLTCYTLITNYQNAVWQFQRAQTTSERTYWDGRLHYWWAAAANKGCWTGWTP